MLSLETYTDLYNRRAAGTLEPDKLAALNLLDQKGRTAPLEAMRQASPQVPATQTEMPTSSPGPPPPPQFTSSQTNTVDATRPTTTPTTGVSQGELADLERKRAHHVAATGRVAPTATGLPPNFALAQQENELLQRAMPTAPPGAPPTTAPAAPAPVTPATAPPTTTVPPAAPVVPVAPAPAAAPSPAPARQPAYPDTSRAPRPQDGITSKEVMQQIAMEGRADPGALWADRLNLPAAEMPGGKYEGAERFAGATPGDLTRSLKEHPFLTPLNILGAPMNSIAAAATQAARPFMSGKNAALAGDAAGIASGLLLPGVPGTGAYRAAPVVKQLGKVAATEGRAAAAASSARATAELATKGLKRDPQKALTAFQQYVDAAHAAANPAEMKAALQRAVAVAERQWPGAQFDHVERIKSVLDQMGRLEKTIGSRQFITRSARKVAKGVAKGLGYTMLAQYIGRADKKGMSATPQPLGQGGSRP